MKLGTKSLLFGYHQFLLHPLMVAWAWVKLYGWTWDPRIWTAFFVHDIGYWGRPNMDGLEGKDHPFLGAHIMHRLFDSWVTESDEWYKFSLYHSRSIAYTYFAPLSKLCFADKLAFILYPAWLIRLLGGLSGENAEYLKKDGFEPGKDAFNGWIEAAKKYNVDTLTKEGLKWD